MSKKVYVGIGHGGSDSGAVANGMREKDLTLSIGKYCNERLKQYGIETRISRTKDCDSSIRSKAAASDAFGADVCMDIHINAGGGNGSEVFYSHVSPRGKKLAQAIVDATLKIGQNTRGIKTKLDTDGTDYFGMIRIPEAPAVLVECAFIDNKADVQIINTEAKRKVFGYAIADGVAKYLGVKMPAAKPTTKPTTTTTPTVSGAIKAGSVVNIKSGAKYGGLSSSRGKSVPAAQIGSKKHTVAKIQTNGGVSEALLKEINSWVAVSSLKLATATAAKAVTVGCKVKVKKGAKSYTGQSIAEFVYNNVYKVDELNGKRAVLDKNGICTAFNVNDLIVQ